MTINEVNTNLAKIREVVDVDASGADIDSVVELGQKLSSLMGLAAECQSQAQRILRNENLIAIKELEDRKLTPTVLMKIVDAKCSEHIARYEYAQRISASISHKLDFIRSVISLHKTEVQNSMMQ